MGPPLALVRQTPRLRVGRVSPDGAYYANNPRAFKRSLRCFGERSYDAHADNSGCPRYWFMFCKLSQSFRSAIVLLVRIFGSHLSDPGSSPGGGIAQRARCLEIDGKIVLAPDS